MQRRKGTRALDVKVMETEVCEINLANGSGHGELGPSEPNLWELLLPCYLVVGGSLPASHFLQLTVLLPL